MVDSLLGTKILQLKNSSNEAIRTFSENTGMQDELQTYYDLACEISNSNKIESTQFYCQ